MYSTFQCFVCFLSISRIINNAPIRWFDLQKIYQLLSYSKEDWHCRNKLMATQSETVVLAILISFGSIVSSLFMPWCQSSLLLSTPKRAKWISAMDISSIWECSSVHMYASIWNALWYAQITLCTKETGTGAYGLLLIFKIMLLPIFWQKKYYGFLDQSYIWRTKNKPLSQINM